MKKILILILVLSLSLSVMVGCDKLTELVPGLENILPGAHQHNFVEGKCECGETDPNYVAPHEHDFVDGKCECGEKDPNYVETPKVDADLKAAYDYVHQNTKTIAEKTGANYKVILNAPVGSKNYEVVWEIIGTDEVVINGDTVVVPEPTADINYTLKFTVTNEKGETLSREYSHIVPKFKYNTFAEYAAAEDEAPLVICGIVSGVFSKTTGSSANGLYIQDLNNEGGYYVYNLTDDPNGVILPGMTVKVKGNKDLYNGTYELVDAEVVVIDETIKAVEPIDYTELLLGAAALNDAALVEKQGMLVTVKGVTLLEAGDNGYYYFQAGNHKVYLRISSSNNATTKEALETIKSIHGANYGNLADITGVISLYNGNFYLSPVSADMISNIKVPERSDVEKVQMELDTLKLDSKLTSDKVIDLLANGVNFTDVIFVWTVDGGDHATLVDGKLSVVIPDAETKITVTVTASCGEASDSKTFEIILSKTLTSIADAIAIGSAQEHNTYTEDKYLVAGIITEVYNDQYGNMYITDEAGNKFTIYGTYSADGSTKYGAMETKPVAGDYVVILGSIGQYNSTAQVKNGWIQSWINPTSVEDAINIGAAKDHNDFTGDKILVTGTITEVYNDTYGNMYITDEAGNVLTIYGSYDATGANRYDAMTVKPVAGDVVTILGVPGRYNDTKQIKNGWIVAVTAGSTETPHEHVFVEGKCECGVEDPNYVPPTVDPDPVGGVELTVDSLGVASQSYAAGTATVGGVSFEFIQIGNYGDGIQVRDKNGNTSTLWNTTAFGSAIKEIVLVYSDSKDVTYANPDCEIFTFGNAMGEATCTVKLSTEAGVKTYTITPDAETYTFFKFEHDLGYTMYWKSITIVLVDGSTVTPGGSGTTETPHEHVFVEGKCECGVEDPNYVPPTVDPDPVGGVELTVDSLGVASQSYAAGTATVGGVSFEFIQIGNYGDGIQVRDKNGNTSTLWNTTAFGSAIKEIVLVYSDSKDVTYANPDCEIFTFGNAMGEATCTVKLSTEAGVKTYTITPDAETYTFFKFEHDLGYTMYWKSITIVLVDGTVVTA